MDGNAGRAGAAAFLRGRAQQSRSLGGRGAGWGPWVFAEQGGRGHIRGTSGRGAPDKAGGISSSPKGAPEWSGRWAARSGGGLAEF